MPDTGKTETPSVTTIRHAQLKEDDGPEEYRESLLGLLAQTEKEAILPEGQSRPGPRAQGSLLSDRTSNKQIKKRQTVIERPIHSSSLTQSAVLDNVVKPPN